MTQASLSTDHSSPTQRLGPDAPANPRQATDSEGALWVFGVTAVTLIFAAILMVGLLTQQAIEDAALNGFMFAVAVGIAGVGLVAFAYVMTLARRAGYIATEAPAATAERHQETTRSKAGVEDDGLRVAPAVTAGIGVAKRRSRVEEQVRRSRQATAIAAAAMAQQQTRPNPAVGAAVLARTSAPVVRSQPARPPQARPAPPQLRLPAPPVRPRTNAAMFQATVAGVRAGSFPTPMRPLPPSAFSRP